MNTTNRHPKGLYLIFATSTAERFSYYGMRAIFILFLTQALLLDTETAASIYGSYTGLVYLTPLVCGYFGETGNPQDFKWGFLIAAIVTVLTVVLALFFYGCFGNDWISIGIFTACIVFPASILMDGSLTKIERDRILVIYIIAFFVIFFWAAYEQAGASLTLFASEQTDRVILGWEMPASWIQSFNPFFVVMSAAASVILFLLSKKLQKMMHGVE